MLRAGGVVALPTDTVYGICVALDTPGGVERLFAIKRRPPDKGIMLLLERLEQARVDRGHDRGGDRPRRARAGPAGSRSSSRSVRTGRCPPR